MEKTAALLSKRDVDAVSYQVIGAAIVVHKKLGPGLLESVYQKCLAHELKSRSIDFVEGLFTPILYNDLKLMADLRCDLYVEDCLVVEIKSVEGILPVHHAQCYTYMKLLRAPKGIVLNFNCVHLFKEGQKTLVNEYFRELPE